ncbi:MAG: tetratricopeptide repeat protein [Candidatus Methylomirabilales bacterium]
MALLILLIGLLVTPSVTAGTGPSELVAEWRIVSVRYHKEPARLDEIRNGLEQTIQTNSHVENLLALAHVCFLWGDILAKTRDEKLEAYDRGRQAAKRVVELEPKNPTAHFLYAVNTARWGEVNGILSSLFLLPTVKKEMNITLNLDPNFTPVYALAGNVYYEVPGLFGGDLDKAEAMFRKGLEQDPTFTAMRVGLAKTLIKKGRIDEARQELQAVLDEKEPRNMAEWTLRDSKEARELLDSIKDKSADE